MTYTGTSMERECALAEVTGAAIEGGAFKAVKYDGSGNVVLASTAGEAIAGILPAQTPDALESGAGVTVQVAGLGRMLAGGALKKGDLLAVSATGAAVKAAAGQTVIGMAREAGASGAILRVQLLLGGVTLPTAG